MMEPPIHNQRISRKIVWLNFRPLDVLLNIGKLILCADGQMQQWYPDINTLMAYNFENIHLYSIKQRHWQVCLALS
jgi:hypothetical protein